MPGMLEIDWRDADVGVDYIPWVWFQITGVFDVREHMIFVPANGEECPARCTVAVESKEAVLDYVASSKCRAFNEKYDVELGRLKVIFTSVARSEVSVIYWAPESEGYEKWDVGIRKVPEIAPDDLDIISAKGKEGKARLVQHLRRERDPRLVKAKKVAVLKAKGCLECEACGFDFSQRYVDVGSDFCEVHHRIPLATTSKRVGTSTSLEQLAILCSNCHRMIHRTCPMESVKSFQGRLI